MKKTWLRQNKWDSPRIIRKRSCSKMISHCKDNTPFQSLFADREIEKPNIDLKFNLFSQKHGKNLVVNHMLGQIALVGVGELNIKEFEDQLRKLTTVLLYQIKDNSNATLVGEVSIQGQWIHSKVKYLSDLLTRWEKQIVNNQQELKDLEI